MKIAAAYLRVSTEEQDEYSLDSQLKLIREYAQKNDYIIPKEYVFVDDGISGRTAAKRGAFQNMIAMAKDAEHPFDAILLWKFSRFARNQEESIVYKSALKKCSVDIISISEPLPEGPFASLIERIIEWMDEFYSIRLSGEVKRGMAEKASRGEIVTPPSFGYDVKDGLYVPNDDAPTVREIFERYVSGEGMARIARDLTSRGVRTRRGNPPENRFVEYILNNPVYIGKIRWSKEGRAASLRDYHNENILISDGSHEPIISAELWDAVQARLAEEKKKYRRNVRKNEPVSWMLKGLCVCSACGSTLCYTNLACPSMQCHKYAHGQCTVSHALSIAKANKLVIEALESCCSSLSFNVVPSQPRKEPTGKDYAKLIKAEERKLDRVLEAYEAGIDTLEEYAVKKRKIQAAIDELRQQMPAPEHHEYDPAAFAAKVADVVALCKSPDVTEEAKNDALRSVISKIVYDKPNNRLDLFFYT